MENLKTDSAIIINESSHGSQNIKDLNAHIEKAQTFFFKRNMDGQTPGINLYFLEFVNMENDEKKDFLSLSVKYPLLAAYLQSLELQKKGNINLMSEHQLMQNFMSTPLEERSYIYQEFVLLEKLRKDVELKIDTESYPKEVAMENWNRGKEFMYHRDCAVDFLSMGKKFNQEYLTALKLETKLSVERHKAVSKQITTAVTDAKADSKAIRIHIQFGTGHVPGL